MGAPNTSKDLLNLEQNTTTTCSSIDSTLLVCKRGSLPQASKPNTTSGKLVTSSVPKSQVLGKLKDFLGVIAEANTRLQHDAKDKSSMDYDIEVLNGNEKEYIEMDLILGVADLHTPEAVTAAESSMAGSQLAIPLAAACCTESSSSESDNEDEENGDGNDETCSSNQLEESNSGKNMVLKSGRLKKRKKMIEFL